MSVVRLLGLDPGLRQTGWGIIETEGSHLRHLANGTISTNARHTTAERLVTLKGRVAVPSSLNVGALDLQNPAKIRLASRERDLAARLMNAYVAMGCIPTWTCAPYQAGYRPKCGDDIAWAESNAVVFANSVLGARTNRYGDFMDICCAITGRAPFAGLHNAENRYARILVDTSALSSRLKNQDMFFPVLGSWLGRITGGEIAVIDGMPADVSEDQLKALGASTKRSSISTPGSSAPWDRPSNTRRRDRGQATAP